MAESFLRYVETVQECGTAVDMALSGNALHVRATMLEKTPFTDAGGELFHAPSPSFTPWYDLHELLENHDDNVVGRITSVSQSIGNSSSNSRSGGGGDNKLTAHCNITSWLQLPYVIWESVFYAVMLMNFSRLCSLDAQMYPKFT